MTDTPSILLSQVDSYQKVILFLALQCVSRLWRHWHEAYFKLPVGSRMNEKFNMGECSLIKKKKKKTYLLCSLCTVFQKEQIKSKKLYKDIGRFIQMWCYLSWEKYFSAGQKTKERDENVMYPAKQKWSYSTPFPSPGNNPSIWTPNLNFTFQALAGQCDSLGLGASQDALVPENRSRKMSNGGDKWYPKSYQCLLIKFSAKTYEIWGLWDLIQG